MAAIGIVVGGLVGGGWGQEASAEPTVQQFLLAWQQQNYRAAAGYTTGRRTSVASALAGAFHQVDASALFLGMAGIVQHGNNAVAHFSALVDLAQQGHQWTYNGEFVLHRFRSGWKVEWSPKVINPSLGPGDRLAVVTTMPSRAPILDASGHPLEVNSPVYVVGVRPAGLSRPGKTAAGLAKLTGLDASQMLGLISAAPPTTFLKLITLDPSSYGRLRTRLNRVPGLRVRRTHERLFASTAADVVGRVGTEDAAVVRDEGESYQPGTTVGLTGLQATFQDRLAGTPTTKVVVDTAGGRQVAVLHTWPGKPSTPVRTTIDPGVQGAARHALAAPGDTAAQIVAVQPSTGRILAVASRSGRGGARLPSGGALDARARPGATFTIVSTAALLGTGFSAHASVPCTSVVDVGGRHFKSPRDSANLGAQPPFSADFANACRTAFAGLSRRLSVSTFERTVRGFGIGSHWQLPVHVFSGSAPRASDDGQLAAETLGSGVRVSPLAMACVAAEVASGVRREPMLVVRPDDPSAAARAPLAAGALSSLRGLMRTAVTSGSASAADVPGAPVYGQAAQFRTGSGRSSAWRSWFVGYRKDVAFAVLESGRSPGVSASAVAARFLRALPSS